MILVKTPDGSGWGLPGDRWYCLDDLFSALPASPPPSGEGTGDGFPEAFAAEVGKVLRDEKPNRDPRRPHRRLLCEFVKMLRDDGGDMEAREFFRLAGPLSEAREALVASA